MCREGLSSRSPSSNKQRVPRESGGIRVSDRKERTRIRVSESVCRTACVASNQPTEREGVGPLEEKECRNCGRCFHGRAWNRRSALESARGGPSVRRSQMWNGDLNRPRAKATSQMIMGMTDVQVKQQSTSITRKW